jgi:anthranilate phosphoribosyltransferase
MRQGNDLDGTMTHPFAQFIQILGKGRRGSRDLSENEAEQALAMILSGDVRPEQLGAFLMLIRVKEETPSEVAGFVRAARASLDLPEGLPTVGLDWSTYAGKRRQLPWYMLSALLLASHGTSVLMHGIGAGTEGRIYVPQALEALGLKSSATVGDAVHEIGRRNFAYVPLDVLSPELDDLLELKAILGLRSPVHTVVRMLNPFKAPASIMGIFHPGYDETHQQAAALLGDAHLAVFKGEGGEAERNPDVPCKVRMLARGSMTEDEWPAMFDSRHLKDDTMQLSRLLKLWSGEVQHEYGEAAVVGTTAIALRGMGRAAGISDALSMAEQLWQRRRRDFLGT